MASKATYNLTYGLFVVTAKDGEKDNGCITNTVGQVTTSPNRITLAVNKNNFTHDMIVKTGKFNASILSQAAGNDIFKHFGFQSGREVDKFADFGDVARSENGLYYITKGTNAFISASVVESWDVGTHTLFLADVTEQGVLGGGGHFFSVLQNVDLAGGAVGLDLDVGPHFADIAPQPTENGCEAVCILPAGNFGGINPMLLGEALKNAGCPAQLHVERRTLLNADKQLFV